MSKQDELLFWCKLQNAPFSSVDVATWGLNYFYMRARRTIQEFASDPNNPVRRIPDAECALRGLTKKGRARLAFYEISS